jgi:hypothetical protein
MKKERTTKPKMLPKFELDAPVLESSMYCFTTRVSYSHVFVEGGKISIDETWGMDKQSLITHLTDIIEQLKTFNP